MPTPIELFMDPIALIVIGIYFSLFAWETIYPRHRNMPKVPNDKAKGLVYFGIFFLLSSYLPILVDGFLARFQLVDISDWPVILQVILGILVYQIFLYAWHRAMHTFPLIWRTFHQMHHSMERVDVPSTFFFSPFDMIGLTLLGSVVFALLMGISPEAVTPILLTLNFLSIFQHANIRTPVWLGYIIQRPEQHAIHHARGVHRNNYADLPILDLLFGTFQNPRDFQGQYGFYDGASSKVGDMLLARDISTFRPGPSNH